MKGVRLGAYRILGDLGSGGMGRVFLAEVVDKAPGLETGCPVALKVIHPHLLEKPGFFKRFLRESEIGKSVRHANVVRCHDCDAVLHEGVQQNFLVMEYVEGQTLRDLLEELGRVPEELCRHVGREIAEGLAAIHEAGVVHRDLKPENVLITEDHVVKVMDLGVARLQDEAIRLSQTGAFVGSLEYAAPEQLHSSGDAADGRSDLHALGVLLYELATGRHPFRADDARTVLRSILDDEPRKVGEVNPQLSAFFEEFVQTLLAKDPEARFASASIVARVLDAGERGTWWQSRAQALRVETRRPLRRIRIPRETALYGRDRELARLDALYEQVEAGDGQVLLLEGEAGIGKTRLVDEFVGRLRQGGADVNFLFGSYPPGGAATAAGAFSTAYREQFGAEGLTEVLDGYLQPTPMLIPAFAALLRGESTPTGVEALTKDSLQTVFVHATRGLAAERPTIVLIDDLHFAPEEGLGLFSSLAGSVPGHRVLLLGTMRPGVSESWTANVTRLEHAAHVQLPRLGAKDLALLLRDAFHSERLADELGTKIAIKSDGNPFFAFEIIRGLREGQFITQGPDGTWSSTQVIGDVQVPSSVTDLVQARIAGLGDDEKNLLDVGACCGFEFDPLLVARVLGIEEIPALQSLARVERRHRLVRSAGQSFLFDHHQVQEALYEGLPEPLRERYHAAIAEALEKRLGAADQEPEELDGSLCVDLCEHHLEGGRGDRALRYLGAALRHLEKGFLNDQAIQLADRALAAPNLLQGARRLRVLLRKNGRLELLGRREAQDALLAEAAALAEEIGDASLQSAVERDLGVLRMWTGDLEGAVKHQERALELLQRVGDRAGQVGVVGNLGNAYCALGRYAEAQEQQELHIALAREFAYPQAEAAASINLGIVFKHLGRWTRAQEQFERGMDLAVASGNKRWEASANGNLSNLLHANGRYEEACVVTARALELFRAIGDRRGESGCVENEGLLCLALGRYDEARARFETGLALARELGDVEGEARATGNLGAVYVRLDRLAEGVEHLDRSRCLLRDTGARLRETSATLNLGHLWLRLGRTNTACELLKGSLTQSREIGARLLEATALRYLALHAVEEGDPERAIRLCEEALGLARELGSSLGVADVLLLLGEVQLRQGDVRSAREALDEVVHWSRAQHPGHRALALALLATLPGGDLEAALAACEDRTAGEDPLQVLFWLWKASGRREHLVDAKRRLDARLEHAPEDCRESMLARVRLHREIQEAWDAHPE